MKYIYYEEFQVAIKGTEIILGLIELKIRLIIVEKRQKQFDETSILKI